MKAFFEPLTILIAIIIYYQLGYNKVLDFLKEKIMKNKIKKKGLKKVREDLKRDIKRLEQEKENLIYELLN